MDRKRWLSSNAGIYTLCFLDHIWYSLEHTGNARTYRVSLEHTRITPRTYQEATNDYTGSGLRVIPGYTRILAQGIVIGYAKTPLDCPQLPSRKKAMNNFLGNGHALASLSQGIRNIQRISARKKDGMLKAQGAEDNPRTTRGTPMLGRGTPILGRGTPIPGHELGNHKKKKRNRFF